MLLEGHTAVVTGSGRGLGGPSPGGLLLGHVIAERLGVSAERQFAEFLENGFQRRGLTADVIAAVALFLVSSAASAITGQALNVGGGMIFC